MVINRSYRSKIPSEKEKEVASLLLQLPHLILERESPTAAATSTSSLIWGSKRQRYAISKSHSPVSLFQSPPPPSVPTAAATSTSSLIWGCNRQPSAISNSHSPVSVLQWPPPPSAPVAKTPTLRIVLSTTTASAAVPSTTVVVPAAVPLQAQKLKNAKNPRKRLVGESLKAVPAEVTVSAATAAMPAPETSYVAYQKPYSFCLFPELNCIPVSVNPYLGAEQAEQASVVAAAQARRKRRVEILRRKSHAHIVPAFARAALLPLAR